MAAKGGNISRQIIKAMSVFGGVQAMTILCSVIRTKLVAVWIGPVGIGLFGLYNSAIDMITNISNLGIRSSSVRDISIKTEHGTIAQVATIIAVVRRWTWVLGCIAALFTLSASSLLSQWTFGDTDHSWGFIALSAAIMLNAISNCEQSILQGTHRLRKLAQVSLWGTVTGLATSIPLFYFLREDSIVPSIILYSAALAFFAWIFRNKEYASMPVSLSLGETVAQGTGFVKLGFFMTLGSFLSLLSFYIFVAYLNHTSGAETVGHYQAGYTLVHRYAGLIFTSIATEYYPRLARVCQSKIRTGLFVSQENNIILSILAPLISVFLLFRQVIVNLLYSADFNTVIPFISYSCIGIVFQAISWCMAYVIVAKGKGKIFIITESISTVIGLMLHIAFYNLGGLDALGIAYTAWYIIYTIIVGIVYYITFGLSLHRSSLLTAAYAVAVTVATIAALHYGLWYVAATISAISIIVGIRAMRKIFM